MAKKLTPDQKAFQKKLRRIGRRVKSINGYNEAINLIIQMSNESTSRMSELHAAIKNGEITQEKLENVRRYISEAEELTNVFLRNALVSPEYGIVTVDIHPYITKIEDLWREVHRITLPEQA